MDDLATIYYRNDDPELVALEAALYIEENFGVHLSDDEISPDRVGSPEAVRRLLAEKGLS